MAVISVIAGLRLAVAISVVAGLGLVVGFSGGLFLWWVILVVAMCGAMVVGLMAVVARLGFWLYKVVVVAWMLGIL